MFSFTACLTLFLVTLTAALPNPIASSWNHGLNADLQKRNTTNPSVYVCQEL